jgi:class 3 adenylate cyclase/CheY-like chemotaxis protein
MEKLIWVIGFDRNDMLNVQRQINATGSMKAFSMLSYEAVERAVVSQNKGEHSRISTPALIILDYDSCVGDEFQAVSLIKNQQSLAGVPMFFMTEKKSHEIDEICYEKGAMVVLTKPFSKTGILRMERTAWQHEVTKNYEKMLQKQASDLQAAREIVRLNEQLKSRNELLHQIFGRYFSDKVVDVILDNPEHAGLGGERREVTILMSDIRGFTSISEEMEPERMTSLLNFYFGKMVDAITQYHGIVIEFVGDGILAVFGAPFPSQEHTEEAVAAAITMQNSMGEVNKYCNKNGYPVLEMGIGIHRGEVFIGNVGSEKMMRYNVVGRVVNECSRIESYTVGGQILASTEGLNRISCPVETHNQMEIIAKGLQRPLIAHEIIGIGGSYQVQVENVEFDVLTPILDWIVFNLYPVKGKMIEETPIAARLVQFSCKRAVVELEDFQAELDVYSDVEIFAAKQNGHAIFTGVYAKVVKRQFDHVTLHFTHVSHSFQQFSDYIGAVGNSEPEKG